MKVNRFAGLGAVFGCGLLLLGCEAANDRSGQASAPPEGFACPAAGTRVTFTDGATITFRGPDPADAAVCIVSTTTNPAQQRLLNFWTLPATDAPSLRRGLSALWPLAPGKTANFSHVGRTNDGQTFLFREAWRVDRTERISIAGAARDVLVITRTQEGQTPNNHLSTTTFRYDPATRIFLSSSIEVMRGSTSARPFEVTRIENP